MEYKIKCKFCGDIQIINKVHYDEIIKDGCDDECWVCLRVGYEPVPVEGEQMYAHSVKNPHIIHMRRKYEDSEYRWAPEEYGEFHQYRYLCCGSYTPEKATDNKEEVTCKNCIKLMDET